MDLYGKLPITFIPNEGQKDSSVKYYTYRKQFQCHFTNEGVCYTFFEHSPSTLKAPQTDQDPKNMTKDYKIRGITLAFRFVDANPQMQIEAQKKEIGKVNYVNGNDPMKWVTNLSTFREIVYREVWPGIDLVFHEKDGQLKYDVILQPGADINQIQLTYSGGDELSLDEEGNLNIVTPFGIFQDQKPVSYQDIDGKQVLVDSGFVLHQDEFGSCAFSFEIGNNYDPRFPLWIDPGILFYSTYLGGGDDDRGISIDIDASGNAYVTGVTSSINFPFTPGAFDTTFNGTQDAFITKLNAIGSALVYSTFLGGSGGNTFARSIAVDLSGNAYVTGSTTSMNFPTTAGAFDTTFNGTQDAFITKLNATGSNLVYSTFLGGAGGNTDSNGIVVDLSNNAYVAGRTDTENFPTTAGAFDTTFSGGADAFITKLNATGNSLVYSTFLGATDGDSTSNGIVIDNGNNAYVTGLTSASLFPTTSGAFDTSFNGGEDAFVTKLNPAGNALVFSTFLGGALSDTGNSIAIDIVGNVYVTGATLSTNFPTTPFAFDTLFHTGSGTDAFVSKLNPTGSTLLYSTYLGGKNSDRGIGIAVDNGGNAYVTGATSSDDFPVTNDGFDITYNGGEDIFISKINTNAPSPTASLVSSTYVGGSGDDAGFGITIDTIGSTAYVTGRTDSTAFPTTVSAFDRSYNGGSDDVFVLRIQF